MQCVQRSDCRSANLQSFAAARHFCSAKILAGGLRWGWGPQRSRQRHRPRKEISRGNLLCAASGLANLSYPRRLSTQKYVTTPDWSHVRVGQPQGARGTRSLCFGRSPEEPLSRGSFGQLLRGGSTPRFFSQIRSVGSKPPGWQGTASQPLLLGPRVQPKSPPLPAGSKKSPLTPRRAQKRTCLAAGPFLFPNYSSSSPAGASSARMDSEIRLCS